MEEILEVYDLEGNLIGDQDRSKFYTEIRKEYSDTGNVTRKIQTVRILIMNSSGKIFLQKRSAEKEENPNLYDKTIGGHIPKGESPTVTVVRECSEELGFAAAVVPKEEFATSVRSTDLSIIGLVRLVEKDDAFISVRENKDGQFKQPDITHFYIGYYDGAMRFKDGEASGIELFTLEELEKELKNNTNKFTQDLHYMIERFRSKLVPLN